MLSFWRRRPEPDEGFWREALVYTAVAERAMSLVDVCGEHDLVREVQPILDSVWGGVSRGRRPDGRSPIRRLERLGGSEAPDDDQPIYLAHEALEALYAAAIVAFELRRL